MLLFTENNTGGQLDTQNDDPTAGKGQENGSKGIEQPQIQDDQEQDVVDDDSGEDGQDLIEGRERKVQNHAYQQLVFRPGQPFFYSNHCALIPREYSSQNNAHDDFIPAYALHMYTANT